MMLCIMKKKQDVIYSLKESIISGATCIELVAKKGSKVLNCSNKCEDGTSGSTYPVPKTFNKLTVVEFEINRETNQECRIKE